ncbi:hypothetical protein FHR90_001921 [Endobacter medicaginis]|uniref:Uncharacterized protein n=1 Tax=Endobacter medicaginis TaxID=1181271 RepID=A0A839UZP0_9PROT|nr:hypothetical protein [Endobacter medicaginis]MBB3174085.1 hypothetical protein [Endobacter medicaginis]MCX5476083.1 hypothetical protein [Endobacter medicaginis]NVN30660.1 hypothetical protein [Endobacter medicaginis]
MTRMHLRLLGCATALLLSAPFSSLPVEALFRFVDATRRTVWARGCGRCVSG